MRSDTAVTTMFARHAWPASTPVNRDSPKRRERSRDLLWALAHFVHTWEYADRRTAWKLGRRLETGRPVVFLATWFRASGRGPEEIGVRGEAALGAGVPGERCERALAPVAAEPRGEPRVAEELREAVTELVDVPGLDEEPRHAVLDDLGQAADAAADDRRAARHRLEGDEPEELRDGDAAPEAGLVDGGKRENRRLAEEAGKVVVRDGTEEADVPPPGQALEQRGVVALGWVAVVAAGADDRERRPPGQRPDQPVDALVRRQAPDEEDASAAGVFAGAVAVAVDAAVDDARAGGWCAELARRTLGDRQEPVEETREESCPVAALQAVVGHDGAAPAGPRRQRGDAARRASHMVRVDDVCARQCRRELGRDGVGRMAEVRDRSQDAHAEPSRLTRKPPLPPERDELAIDVPRDRPRELERIALAAAEDAVHPECGRSDVYDAHLVVSLITLGDPRRLTGGYLYHRRLAEEAPRHGARVVFLSFRERPFPLAALQGPAVLAHAHSAGAHAIVLDSIAAALAAPALALRPPGLPVLGMLHQPPGGIDHGPLRVRAQAALDRLAYERAELLLVASDLLADQVAESGFARERIRVLPPGRDTPPPAAGAAPDLRGGRRAAFLCVSNWLERKGILELLDAFARLRPDAGTLHLAGDEDADAEYGARVRRRLAEPDLAGRVVRHGRLARDEVSALYAGADVFVLPAFREPYGTVWGEAMAFGLPVVGWRAGNLPHLADDGREGLLAAPGDVDALARALAGLAEDERLRLALGAAARRRALSRPTWKEVGEAFFGAVRLVARQPAGVQT